MSTHMFAWYDKRLYLGQHVCLCMCVHMCSGFEMQKFGECVCAHVYVLVFFFFFLML